MKNKIINHLKEKQSQSIESMCTAEKNQSFIIDCSWCFTSVFLLIAYLNFIEYQSISAFTITIIINLVMVIFLSFLRIFYILIYFFPRLTEKQYSFLKVLDKVITLFCDFCMIYFIIIWK